MASIIRIKRSEVSGNPSTLAAGELAYSALADTGSNGGDRLYIGIGTETAGDAANHVVIGGKFFTDAVTAATSANTANTIVKRDGSGNFSAGTITADLSGNASTASTWETARTFSLNGALTGSVSVDGSQDVSLTAALAAGAFVLGVNGDSGTASVDLASGSLTLSGGTGLTATASGSTVTVDLDDTTVTAGSYGSSSEIATFTVDAQGRLTAAGTASIATSLGIAGDTGTDTVALASDTLTFTGDTGITTTVSDNEVTIDLDDTTVTAGSYGSSTEIPTFTVDQQGRLTAAGTASISTTLSVSADTGSGDGVDLATDTLTIAGDDAQGIDTSISGDTVTITAKDATTSQKGVASFDTGDFSVASGAVSIKNGGVSNIQLENDSITFGTTAVELGGTSLTLAGVQQLDVDNIRIDGNEISSTDTNGNISLNPNGTGTVAVNSARITGLAEPVDATDAATKGYVDAARSGLDVKQSVRVATTANITLSGTQTIDGVALSVGNRVLVKDQTTGSQNGIYVVAAGSWTRATDADEPNEVTPGMFFFVEEGTTYADSGFVLASDGPLVVGTDSLTFNQFSGTGSIEAGAGLGKLGATIFVNVANGIEISADAVQLASSVAGAGLTYTNGVLAIGETANRITVNADSIDIASTYVGQTSITTLGTISSGTWNGTTIGVGYGGTGLTSYSVGDILVASGSGTLSKLAVGASGKVLQSNGTTLVYADIDGGTY